MSRAAPVDAEVASAAYTWSAALTVRCRSAGRYAPYPGAAEGAPPGFLRTGIRTVALGLRARRGASAPRAYGRR